MVGYRDNSDVAKKVAEAAQKKSNDWPMVIFIGNVSEITWMGYSMETKSATSRATFLYFMILRFFSFLSFKLQVIRLAQGHWSCMPTH